MIFRRREDDNSIEKENSSERVESTEVLSVIERLLRMFQIQFHWRKEKYCYSNGRQFVDHEKDDEN